MRCAKRKMTGGEIVRTFKDASPEANVGAYQNENVLGVLYWAGLFRELVRRTRSVFKQTDYTADPRGKIIRIANSLVVV